jgi:hypothetical protein
VAGSLGLAVSSYVYSTGAVGTTPGEASLGGFQASMAGIMVCAVLVLAAVNLMKLQRRKQTRDTSEEVVGLEDEHA